MHFTELSLPEFKRVNFANNNHLQAPEMYERYLALGRETYLVGLKDDSGAILAAGLILGRPWHFGYKSFRIAGGWLMDYTADNAHAILKALTDGARKFCREKRAIVLTVMPKIIREISDIEDSAPLEKLFPDLPSEFERLGYKYLGEFEQFKWVYSLYLKNRRPEEIFKHFRKGHRCQIRRAEKLNFRLRELEGKDADLIKSIISQTGERQNFQDPPAEYYASMKKYFGDKVKLMVAEIPASSLPASSAAQTPATLSEKTPAYIPTTAAMFLSDADELVYLAGGSVRQYQIYGGAHYLQWEMIKSALAQGYENYNFFGTKPIPGNGVYNFKHGFRGHVEELVGTFALPIGLLGRLYLARIKPLKFRDIN